MKKYDYITSAVDTKVCTAPVTIVSVIVTPDANQKADITLYDGEGTKDPEIIKIRTLANDTKVINFAPGLVTERGLYLDVGSNVADVLIQFIWGKE